MDQVYILDLADNYLPFFDYEGNYTTIENKRIFTAKENLQKSEGFIIISPEWNGMVTAGLKNIFLHFSKEEFGHKPALITSVSADRGGAYPIAELRMSSYKNSRINYIPEHLIINQVTKVLNDDNLNTDDNNDKYIKSRVDYSLILLNEYIKAMKQIRNSGVIDYQRFGNGM